MVSAYKIFWYGFQIGAKKAVPKYASKGASSLIIGNVLLTHSKKDAEKIRKNIANTPCEGAHEFKITDKQFGLIKIFNNKPFAGWKMEDIEPLKNCNMPHLVVNNRGNIALIPITNKQFLGTDALQRKSIWL